MTIKRRLFLSNILMLTIPIILTILTFSGVILLIMSVTGIKDVQSFRERNAFYGAVNQAEKIYETIDISDFQSIKRSADNFNAIYKDFNISMSVYEKNALTYPSNGITNRIIEIALSENYDVLIIEGADAVNSTHLGDYKFLITSTNFSLYSEDIFEDYFYIGILMFVFSIMVVLCINRVLTHLVSKRITTPLELLVSGVHELRDGNLSFRIEYKYKDEFKSVCDDFNEMAQHLHEMVAARQKDENSRKELIAGISHDLRTPLTSIKAYVEGIEKGIASTPQVQKRYIDIIKTKADELERIIAQLFMFSKLDIGEFPLKTERVDINEVLRCFLTETASEFESQGLSVSLITNSKKSYADIDVLQFRNVLHNILGNSAKYKADDAAMSEILCEESGDGIIISITDNGPGVPDDSTDKIFDIFYRDDAARKDPSEGSGLGLAIARKTIERFSGAIFAKNVPGGGLAVIMTLPKAGGTV